jgi:hypothetical protein
MRLGPRSSAHCRVRLHSHYALCIVLVSSSLVEAGDWVNKFTVTCKQTVQEIINGTLEMGNITQTTIWENNYMYNGTARELGNSYRREDYLTLTYEGKH